MRTWDLKAEFYDLRKKLFPFNLILSHELAGLQELLQGANLDRYILDVGTGTGAALALLPEHGRVFAVDHSFAMLKKARSLRQAAFVVADAGFLPFKSGLFGLITAVGVFEYQKNRAGFLKELQRVAASESSLLVTFAQFSLVNLLRVLLGSRLYFISEKGFGALIARLGLAATGLIRRPLQRQVLLRNRQGCQ